MFDTISEIQGSFWAKPPPPSALESATLCSRTDCDSPPPPTLPVITAFPLLVRPQILTEVPRSPSCGM